MKAIYSITEQDAVAELRNEWLLDDPEQQARIRGASAAEVVNLAQTYWQRGHKAGIMSAFMTLKDEYLDAAQELLEAFGPKMDG